MIFKCGSGDGLSRNCLSGWLKVQLSGAESRNFREWDCSFVAFKKFLSMLKFEIYWPFPAKVGGEVAGRTNIFFLKPGQTLCNKRWLLIGVIGYTCLKLYHCIVWALLKYNTPSPQGKNSLIPYILERMSFLGTTRRTWDPSLRLKIYWRSAHIKMPKERVGKWNSNFLSICAYL